MSNLNNLIEAQVQKVPQHFLRQLVKRKLKGHGFEDKGLLNALTEHILTMNGEPFHWDDGDDGPTKNLKIEFTKHDADDLEKDVMAFLEDDLPNVIFRAVKSTAKSLVKRLEKDWPEVKVDECAGNRHFRERLDLRWAAGLDPLRMMLIASREIGQAYADKLARSKAKSGLIKREAIAILHMRACQTSLEILTLLENGLPDGAYARWRTLYEITVVAFVIDRFGDEIAERYLAHEVVSMRESVINEFRYDGENYLPEELEGGLRELEENFQAAVMEYGKPFKGPYGWAAHNLDNRSPRFQDLETAVDWDALPPDYKWSSYKIHAGVAGALRSLGNIGDQHFIHSGATNAGLETPAMHTAFSLMQITSLVFGKVSDLETQVQMQSMVILRDKVVEQCRKAAKKLLKDEMEFQSGYDE